MATTPHPLDDLAEEVTRALNIPFRATGRASIVFREPLRVTDWSVPMILGGHVVRDGDFPVPTDFVGHALFAGLRVTARDGGGRPSWSCILSEHAARAIVEAVEDTGNEGWLVGRDVLLDAAARVAVSRPSLPRPHKVA